MKRFLCLLCFVILIFSLFGCSNKDKIEVEQVEKEEIDIVGTLKNEVDIKTSEVYSNLIDRFKEEDTEDKHMWYLYDNIGAGLTIEGISSVKNEDIFNMLSELKTVDFSSFNNRVINMEERIEDIVGENLDLYIPQVIEIIEEPLEEVQEIIEETEVLEDAEIVEEIIEENLLVGEIFINNSGVEYGIIKNGYENQLKFTIRSTFDSFEEFNKFNTFLFENFKIDYSYHNGVKSVFDNFLNGQLEQLYLEINLRDEVKGRENGVVVANFMCDNLEDKLRIDVNWEYFIPID